jgi:Na+/H+-dicarboxylate symporter
VLCFGLGRSAGLGAAGLVTVYVLIYVGVNLLYIAMLYPLTAALGGGSMRRFARAVAPAQMVALSTRSSIAALPALVEGGRRHLALPMSATGFVLPLSVTTVKVSLTVGVPLKVMFLAHGFGVHVSPGQMLALAGILLLLNFSTVGLPAGGGSFRTLPAYVAVGMSIEGVVILEAVDLIPDIFKTLVNVTSDLSIAAVLSRPARPGPR